MFDIAWTELLVVAVIAIIVVGPKELPGMLRAFGKTFGQVRRTAREFQSTFNDALREAEREAGMDEVRKNLDGVKNMNPAKDLSKSLNETKAALDKTVSEKPTAAPAATKSAAPATTPTAGAAATATAASAATATAASGAAAGETSAASDSVVPLKPSETGPRPAAETPAPEKAADGTPAPEKAAADGR